MITMLSAVIFRWRRVVLLAGLAVAVVVFLVAELTHPLVVAALYALMVPPLVMAIIIANVINRRPRRTFDIVPAVSASGTPLLPWEALNVAQPVEAVDRFAMRLRYALPDLVSFDGLATDRRMVRFEGALPGWLTWPAYIVALIALNHAASGA